MNGMPRPVFLCCPTRNELHNLTRLLPAWSLYCDRIIVVDQGSTDGSVGYLGAHAKVTLVPNETAEFNETHRINLALQCARKLATDAVLLFLDADETLSASVLTSHEWRRFISGEAGTAGFFRWVQLFSSVRRHIAVGLGAPVHQPYAFIDDGRPFSGGIMHGPRGPGLHEPTRSFYFDDVVNLHFFLVNREVHRKKQNWYKHYWFDKGAKYFYTNRNHALYERIDASRIADCPPSWFQGFADAGMDVSSAESPDILWYDVEILRGMQRHGHRAYWLLDIWNQDWERARHRCLQLGHAGMPDQPIESPPRWISAYTSWTLGRKRERSLLTSALRFAKRKILP
jgi:hypothetical protein